MTKKRLATILSVAASLGTPALAEPCGSADPATRAKIEQLHQRDADASRRSGADARATILSLLTDDVVMIPPGAPPVVGKGAWGKVLAKIDSSASDWVIDSYIEAYPEIVVCGDQAYEWGTITTVAHNQKTNRHATNVGNNMRILKRAPNGDWLIHRAMFSTQSAS